MTEERALAVAREAAHEAGDVLLSYLGRIERDDVRRKSSVRDLVTEADVQSERGIVARLREAFPEDAIVAEEEVADGGDANRGARWYVDPLDGTVNFVHALPAFAVSIARFVDGEPETAVVHVPRLGETFCASRGAGAWLEQPGAERRPLAVSGVATLGEAILATGFPYRRNELEHDNLANFGAFFYDVRGLRRMGSAAIDLAFTAAGRLDGFWELHLSPHDVAAGALLVREAGGVVTDGAGGEDWLHGGSIVAAGPALHEAVRERVRF